MIEDIKIAKALVDLVNGKWLSKSPEVSLTVDPYIESQDFPACIVWFGLQNIEYERDSRNSWRVPSVELTMTIAGRQQNNQAIGVDAMQQVEDWLVFCDEVVAAIQENSVAGSVLKQIETEDRFDTQKLRDDSQFRAYYLLTYAVS